MKLDQVTELAAFIMLGVFIGWVINLIIAV